MGGFLSSLSGGNQRRALRHATQAASGSLTTGRNEALQEIDTGLDRSLDFLAPSREGGLGALTQYLDAVGVNGQPAQQTYFDNFQNDPGYQAELGARLDAIDRTGAARGQSLSGRTLSALADEGQRFQRSAFNDRLDRLSGLSSLGQNAAGQSAGLTTNAFNQRADLDYGFAQQKANLHTGYGNAAAGTYSQGANNIIGGLGSLGKLAMGGFG